MAAKSIFTRAEYKAETARRATHTTCGPLESEPETAEVAIAICNSVYAGHGTCSCQRATHIPICSTMIDAAVQAIRIIRRAQ